jgi:hypothetical protein
LIGRQSLKPESFEKTPCFRVQILWRELTLAELEMALEDPAGPQRATNPLVGRLTCRLVVGLASLSISAFLLRLICTNGLVANPI